MGITFKSNIQATKFINYASGYSGPKDFKFLLDVNGQVYLNSNKDNINLPDVLVSERVGKVVALKGMNLTDYEVIPDNTILRSYVPDLKTFAIMTQQNTPSCLVDPKAPQAWLAHQGQQIYCCYSLDGGRAFIDINQISVISGTGTFEDPQFFRYKNVQLVNVVRENGSSNAVCQYCPNGIAPLIPAYSQIEWGLDHLTIKPPYIPNGASGAIVVKFSEAKRKALNNSNNAKIIMLLKQSELTHLAVTVQPSGQVAIRFFRDGGEHVNYLVPGLYVDRSAFNSFAISWVKGLVTVSLNGKSSVLYMFSMTGNFRCNSLSVVTGLPGWLGESPNFAITDIAVYDRSMLERELIDATKR